MKREAGSTWRGAVPSELILLRREKAGEEGKKDQQVGSNTRLLLHARTRM